MSSFGVKSVRQRVREALQKHLIPELMRRGFERSKRFDVEAGVSQIRQAFPFGQLRRSAEGFEQMVEIQFDKHGGPEFRIGLGLAPRSGLDHSVGHVACEDICVHYLPSYFEMYRYPSLRLWFSPRRWPWHKPTEDDCDKLALWVTGLVPEIEAVLGGRAGSSHIRRAGG